jgi:tRNA threonylcarbamoyladenosine biosynthesis protein TsaE
LKVYYFAPLEWPSRRASSTLIVGRPQGKTEEPGPRLEDFTLARLLEDEAATAALAGRVAQLARASDVLALAGDLGTGKTVFARAFIRALEGDEEVPSPTFTLVQAYDAPAFTVYHFDLYRLESPDEAYELGIEDAFAEGVSLIEWPDRLGSLLPKERLDVALFQGAAETWRRAVLTGYGSWSVRLKELEFD